MNNYIINCVSYYFGITKKNARDYIKKADTETINEIIKAFKNDTKKAFYND